MIGDLKPYPTYRDSGVPWLEEIPAHWKVLRQRAVVAMLVSNVDKNSVEGEVPVRLCNYTDVYKHDRITGDLPFMQSTASEADIERFRLRVGDVIITKDSEAWNDIGVPALVEYAASDLVCGYHLAILRPREDVLLGRYLLRALQSQTVASQFHVAANGVTRYGLSHDAIKSVRLPIPPTDEQNTIARYLDYVDRRVRRYVAAKRKLIALLNEEKQAIIHRAVTRGLDPSVRLKPSGVEWLGDVPEHWEVRRNGRLFVERNETGFSELPILEVSLRTGIRIRSFENPARKQTLSDRDMYKRALTGNIVYNMMRMWQGAVGVVPCDGLISPAYVVAQPLSGTHAQYYSNLFRTDAYMGAVDMYSHGIVKDRNRLYWEAFKQLPSPHPPLHEQAAITLAISNETNDLDIAIGRLWNEIALMREYRARLIADVVTGKVDVRAVAAGLPAEDFEVDHFMPVEEISDEAAVELQSDEEVV
jgi:type I restriction enzyme S subunit